ncbi:MAG: hypothetical protein PHG14_12045 [Desulfobacter postgatei]|uniref:hypothetical protein n=1 Tax=Desulfobacter postgatei TaxID=2293 RepID=UPI0023F3B3DF|nr:hypothetical protein [Desulfobacter postgatei]MDD4274444.1 hypothetical protein [Desulfobacter postgatei]
MQMSLSELCQSLVDEFAIALTMLKRSHPTVKVNSLKLALGQTGQDIAQSQDASALILDNRYPGSDSGWRLELDLGEQPQAKIEGVKRPIVSRTDAMVLDIIADEPVTVIDGISSRWRDFFANFHVTRVMDLVRVDQRQLEKMILESNSLQVREFRQKAFLLKLPLPALGASDLQNKSLYDILKLPINEVQKSFHHPVTPAETTYLFEVLDLLNVVIDSRHLQKTSLHQLIGL